MFDQDGSYISDLGSPEDHNSINQAEELFGVDINGDNHQGRNVSQLDELLEIRNVGFNTFDDTANLTDLYADVNSGDIFFAAAGDTNYVELLDYDGYNFGINVLDGYTPLAIEEITDSSQGFEYVGNHVLLAYDEYMYQLVGFMFDQYGYYIADLGSPEDQTSINQAEELFGIDLNNDGVGGRNVQVFDTAAYVASKNLTTFPGSSNTKTLFTDINSGELLFADSSDSSNSDQTLLKDRYGYSLSLIHI